MELANYVRRHSFLAQLLFLLSLSIICLSQRFRQNRILLQKKSCSTCVCVASVMCDLCDPVDCSPPGSSVQARILECVTMLFSRGSSQPRDRTCVSYIYLHWQVGSLPPVPPGKPFFLLGISNYKDRLSVKPTYHQTLESAWVWEVEMCSQNTHEWTRRRFFLRGSLSESLKHSVCLEGNQCQ